MFANRLSPIEYDYFSQLDEPSVVMEIILIKNKYLDTKSIKITEFFRILISGYYLDGATSIPTPYENPGRMEIIKLLLLKSNSWDTSNYTVNIHYRNFVSFSCMYWVL